MLLALRAAISLIASGPIAGVGRSSIAIVWAVFFWQSLLTMTPVMGCLWRTPRPTTR